MLLAVNIGNSSIRFGIFKNDKHINSWVINSKVDRTEDEFFALFKGYYLKQEINEKELNHIVVGSVVPKHTNLVCRALRKIHKFDPFLVDRNTPSPINHKSNQLGTDLYANAVGAYELFKRKCIIVDFGTALTLTGIGNDGNMLGVIISPGVVTALQSLVGNTAQLPDIELIAPNKVLGLDTVSCMQSGMIYGYLSMIEGLIDRIKNEIGKDAYVISTGGLCHIFKSLTDKIDYTDKLHTIKGLKALYELNN